ncbi:type VI secretion system ImpA family N-terminal domain-containing protein [Mangrovibacter sp. SLW1]
MNIDAFLAPVSADKPCGDNLEYDADFQAMEQASQGKQSNSLATPLFRQNRQTGPKSKNWPPACWSAVKTCG